MNSNDNKPVSVPARETSKSFQKPDRTLAAALMREQINRLYDANSPQTADQPTEPTPAKDSSSSNAQTANDELAPPYNQSHDNNTDMQTAHQEQWQKYHTAWQQYYQQYYERYYMSQAQAAQTHTDKPHTATKKPSKSAADETVTKDKAIEEIRNDLLTKLKKNSKKVRGNRHFIPAISAFVIMGLFLFLQYNQLIFASVNAYVSPGAANPQTIILDPTTDVKVGPEPKIIIPKINVDAPLVFGLTSLDEGPVQAALKNGVIHYPIPGANANPGEKGNSVFLGHSSNDVFDDGGYKFIFVQLEQLQQGDRFYLNYSGIRYTYSITSTETIMPNEVSKLVTSGDKPTVTLVTCTPIGTAQKRFIVHADQISPDPSKANIATSTSGREKAPQAITGNAPTFFERLFGF